MRFCLPESGAVEKSKQEITLDRTEENVYLIEIVVTLRLHFRLRLGDHAQLVKLLVHS